MAREWLRGWVGLAAAWVLGAAAQGQWSDPLDALEGWEVVTSEGVQASMHADAGRHGAGVRVDFDFQRGTGFCILRRAFPRELPANYVFSFAARAVAPVNNLEFKLLDKSGDNVWWMNRRNFEFPTEWTEFTYRKRHFQFAWGPSAGAPLADTSAFEIAIASATGGKGSVWFDDFEFRELPPAMTPTQPPALQVAPPDESLPARLPEDGAIQWRPPAAGEARLELAFGASVEFGGLGLTWQGAAPERYEIEVSEDGRTWRPAAEVRGSDGGDDWAPLAAEAAAVRIRIPDGAGGCVLQRVRVLPPACGENANALFATIAKSAPRGVWPRHTLGEQPYWTVVGVANDAREALLDTDGALEVDKGQFRIEPFLTIGGRLVTWADVRSTPALADGYLPLPSVTWAIDDLELEITALGTGHAGDSAALARYTLRNRGATPKSATLWLAVRPFQVLPPWQELNLVGGAARIRALAVSEQAITVEAAKTVRLWTAPDHAGATPFSGGEIVAHLARGACPTAREVKDASGWASAAAGYDVELAGGAERSFVAEVPFHAVADAPWSPPADPAAEFAVRFAAERGFWEQALNRAHIELPAAGQKWVDTLRSTMAYILINADGPSIQPGSRTYERSWIRDGAMTSAALLCLGERERVVDFLNWYAPNQYESGMAPCVVDRRGPDPVPEHDSTGQFIYLAAEYYRYTGDLAVLERYWPQVVRGIAYLERLRAERLTPEYRDGTPEQRACYGLVTESISHEGYSAKPRHSYWDNFWLLRGVEDAVEIARLLGRKEEEQRFARLLEEYRAAVRTSIERAMQYKSVSYVPGCAELGDFDATSTAIVYFPTNQAAYLPAEAVDATFEKYWDFFEQRRDGNAWREYTPYEVRLIGTFVRRGEPARAHALADWFFGHQRPGAWNHWAEVVWRDPATPGFIGDMPHTWVGSAYITAFRSMFAYESGRGELTLAAGVRAEWLAEEGVRVNLPTHYGEVSYTLKREASGLVATLRAADPRIRRLVLAVPVAGEVRFENECGWQGDWVRSTPPGEAP